MSSDCTLDPPGTIVVLGTTPAGIEAALYGRCLGYDVRLLAGGDVWAKREWIAPNDPGRRIGPTFRGDIWAKHFPQCDDLRAIWHEPLPMMPDRSMSSLAVSAIAAQLGKRQLESLPLTVGQWIEQSLMEITQTDLLRGRVEEDVFVTRIEWADVESDDVGPSDGLVDGDGDADADADGPIPPDYLLHCSDGASMRTEAVIVADLDLSAIELGFGLPADYFFEIQSSGDDAESTLRDGWRSITAIYAELAGREGLDLYRPARV